VKSPPRLFAGFRALRHRDYRLFFSGQLISLIGSWMQRLAQSWLVLSLTHSPFSLGLVGALQFLPMLVLLPFGGIIADRVSKRALLIGTQTSMMLLAFVLAALVWANTVTYAEILILAFLLGLANVVDNPTRQAFVVEVVGPEDLTNAIALNSTLFNMARLVGPAIAGLLIAGVGVAMCFFLNGVSFLAVIAGLILMRPTPAPPRRASSMAAVRSDLSEGFDYVRHSKPVLAMIALVGAVGTFGINFNVIVPILAGTTLGVGAVGFGWLMSSLGAGSLAGSLWVAYQTKAPRARLILVAGACFGVSLVLLSLARTYEVSLLLLALAGAGQIIFSAQANSFVQLLVPNRLRGRVMSIYMVFWAGTTPIGNALVGWLAESSAAFGPFLLGGVASIVAILAVVPSLWLGAEDQSQTAEKAAETARGIGAG
jgi:predicted MFS family arabinose efflux permease